MSRMDDDGVCRMKRDWLKRTFVINTSPDFQTIQAAAAREFRRTGHSYWQSNILPHLHGHGAPRN